MLEIPGIGQAKALQIVSAISLVKRFYEEEKCGDTIIKNQQNVLSLTYDLRDKKKEYLVCLYLNARNALIKKEIISVGLLDKSLIHPREIFHPAIELNTASIILVHNHPSGDSSPSTKDVEVVQKISQAGEIMGIAVIDFISFTTCPPEYFGRNLHSRCTWFLSNPTCDISRSYLSFMPFVISRMMPSVFWLNRAFLYFTVSWM